MKEVISFVTPPSTFLLSPRVFPNLGVLRVAANAARRGHPVEHCDLTGINNYLEAVRDFAQESSSKVFGITSTTPQMPAAYEVGRAIKEVRPDARTILGGPHPSLVYAAIKARAANKRPQEAAAKLEEMFNTIVAGDGDEAIFDAIRSDAPKVIDADDRRSPYWLSNEAYEALPFPDRDLIDLDSYHYHIEGKRAHSMISQLGCPFPCGFCGGRDTAFLRTIRTRSTASVIREMEELIDYGAEAIMMYDDELNVTPDGLVRLMQETKTLQDRRGLDLRLRGFVKSQLFTEIQAKAMHSAGFRWLLVGYESGSPKMLENMNKRATREQNTESIRIARDNGLKVKALLSLGHPGESQRTVDETLDWLLETKPDDFDCAIITAYPGTPYFDRATENLDGTFTYQVNGDNLHQLPLDHTEKADYYKGDPDGGYSSFVFTDHLSPEQLVEARDRIERTARDELNIPFNPGAPGVDYEHSMGQTLPSNIYRKRE